MCQQGEVVMLLAHWKYRLKKKINHDPHILLSRKKKKEKKKEKKKQTNYMTVLKTLLSTKYNFKYKWSFVTLFEWSVMQKKKNGWL